MRQINKMVNQMIFDVEKNAQFALQVFNAYYRTPDPTGKIYAEFPEFFLINPKILDVKELTIHSQEKKLLEDCKLRAEARGGYIGITKYFDEKFGYHWIKLSVFPFELGDASDDSKSEFFYILNRFVEFTKKNPHVYGDLTAEIKTDNDIASMLHGIKKSGELLKSKLDLYSEAMLVSFNPSWPAAEVKKILATLEHNDQSWNQLFLEYLRYVMRKKSGVSKRKEISRLAREKVGLDSNFLDSSVSNSNQTASLVSMRPVDLLVEQPSEIDQFLVSVERLQDAQASQDLLVLNAAATNDPQLAIPPIAVDLSDDNMAMQGLLDAAQARTLNMVKMKAEATHKALKAEEDKVRVEALAVVTLRKQADEADWVCQVAMERIEQARKIRIREEAEAREMERTYVQSEILAADAARQRGLVAMQAQQAAEQRQLLEIELLAQEQLRLEQEQALQTQITQRLVSVEQTMLAGQERIQSEVVAAHSEAVAEVDSANPHSLSVHAKVSNPIGLELATYEAANSELSKPVYKEISSDNPFAYEEQWREQEADGLMNLKEAKLPQQAELAEVDEQSNVRKMRKSLPLNQAFGLAAMMMLVGFFGYPLIFSEHMTIAHVEPSKPTYSPITNGVTNDLRHSDLSEGLGAQNSEAEAYLTFGSLKMSGHLGLTALPQPIP